VRGVWSSSGGGGILSFGLGVEAVCMESRWRMGCRAGGGGCGDDVEMNAAGC
jgi:hypothetical protein